MKTVEDLLEVIKTACGDLRRQTRLAVDHVYIDWPVSGSVSYDIEDNRDPIVRVTLRHDPTTRQTMAERDAADKRSTQ